MIPSLLNTPNLRDSDPIAMLDLFPLRICHKFTTQNLKQSTVRYMKLIYTISMMEGVHLVHVPALHPPRTRFETMTCRTMRAVLRRYAAPKQSANFKTAGTTTNAELIFQISIPNAS